MPARPAISLAVGRGFPVRTSSRTAVTTASRVRADRAVRPSTVCVTARTVEVVSLPVQRRGNPRSVASGQGVGVSGRNTCMAVDVQGRDTQTDEFGAFDGTETAATADDRGVLADALVDLFAECAARPTPREMAERSGLPLTT